MSSSSSVHDDTFVENVIVVVVVGVVVVGIVVVVVVVVIVVVSHIDVVLGKVQCHRRTCTGMSNLTIGLDQKVEFEQQC